MAITVTPFHVKDQAIEILDQRKLPEETVYQSCTQVEEVAEAIRAMAVRGAPAIGIAAAYGLWLAAQKASSETMMSRLDQAADLLIQARPTAVNLSWAVKQARRHVTDPRQAAKTLRAFADRLMAEDLAQNRRIGEWGRQLFGPSVVLLTHCNTGSLATAGYGTALGVIRSLYHQGQLHHVFVDETRPLLQGARLTAWELHQEQIPSTLIA
ncbi:MAG: S-methyl-5-thioribose-1-phosphate isomerase, partial [Firmicutes bacterium]|nr:S-methyl-5-thioribose-1-phosphate isomerase [Bacillota bacterium]